MDENAFGYQKKRKKTDADDDADDWPISLMAIYDDGNGIDIDDDDDNDWTLVEIADAI